LAVLTDTMHKSGFKLQVAYLCVCVCVCIEILFAQAAILLSLIHSVESGEIVAPLAAQQQQASGESNSLFLRGHIARLLASSFDQLTPYQSRSLCVPVALLR
jgi:hypothetical protein